MRNLSEIKAIIEENTNEGKGTYEGLTSAEIGRHSQSIMFGDDFEGFPSESEWSSLVD